MKGAITILKNKYVIIGIVILAIVLTIYFAGRRAGKDSNAGTNGWDALSAFSPAQLYKSIVESMTGGTKTPPPPPVEGVQTSGEAVIIAKSLYDEMSSWYNKDGVDAAFAKFNLLDFNGKMAVVNQWNAMYHGKDRPGLFTGDFGTLRVELEAENDLLPEMAIAYQFFTVNNIQ